MTGFLNQNDTRLSLDGDWDVDGGLRIVALPSGRKFLGLATAGTGEPVTGVGLHVESHYAGPDALNLDLIPGSLDALKLTNLVAADIAQASEIQLGSYVVPMFSIDPGFNNRVIVADGSGTLQGIAYGAGGTVFLGGSPPTWGTITDAHVSAVAAIDVSKLAGVASDAELTAHEADTTSVHGIANTAQLAVLNVAQTFTAQQRFDATFAQSAAPSTSIAFRLNYGSLTGASQQGLFVDPAFTSAATLEAFAGFFRVETAAAAFTLPTAAAIRIPDATVGSGSAIGTLIGMDVAALTGGGTNIAIRTGNNRVLLGGELELDGAFNHDGSTAAVFGVTPASRTSAYTQSYATASRTLAAYTADSESVVYTGAADGEAKLADLNALRVAYENLRAFVESIAGVLNSHTDDMQLYGWFQ